MSADSYITQAISEMKRIIKAAMIVLMFMAIPMKSWAQTPYRSYADESVMLNFFDIDNVDFRAFLLYNISQDNRFVLIPEEEFGQFILSSKDDNSQFLDEFESFYQDVVADFALLSKNDTYILMNTWKDGVDPQHFLSITMDIAMRNSRTDNDHCSNSLPFCTTDLIEFEAACTSQTANEPGMDDGCIGSSYNPSFYHMRIRIGGQFIIHMEGHDPTNPYQGRDIDFCMWGPYTEEQVASGWACTNLTGDKIIDCCYSADPTEDVYLGYEPGDHTHGGTGHGTINYHMPEVGEYYILMITNFSQQPCVISFTKELWSGPGETDCDILPGIVNNDGPYCVGETIHLSVNDQMNASYAWVGPDGWTSNLQNPERPNCTLEMAGTYTCTTTVGSQFTTASTEVVIYEQPTPSFTATTVCLGQPTAFEGHATGANVANYDWSFGDGGDASGQNVSHTYAEPGTYQVTLTVTAIDGTCPGEITQTVTVNAQPIADAGPDQNLPYPGISTQLNGSGGSSTYTYHWEPSNMVVNPNIPSPQTVTLYEDQTYILTVTNPQGGCTSTDTVTVYIGVSALTVSAEVSPNSLCEGNSAQLQVNASGGSGDFSYSWTPTTGLNASNISNPVATPTQTTTYTCTVTDNIAQYTDHKSVTVTVYHHHTNGTKVIDQSHPDYRCDSIPFDWFGNRIWFKENGTYSFPNNTYPEGQTTHGCDTAMVVTIKDMTYAPNPTKIRCTDEGAVVYGFPYADADTIAVVTNTEFFSFQYNFRIDENYEECVWDSCHWTISKPSWAVEYDSVPELSNGKYYSECTVYVAEHDDDLVVLTATMKNGCGTKERKFYLKSSFLGVDENSAATKVSIMPNPNNGQMRILFEDMEGLTTVKVLDMKGNTIDAFETHVGTGLYSYDYTMKQHTEGVYLFVFANSNRIFTKKVVIIK